MSEMISAMAIEIVEMQYNTFCWVYVTKKQFISLERVRWVSEPNLDTVLRLEFV